MQQDLFTTTICTQLLPQGADRLYAELQNQGQQSCSGNVGRAAAIPPLHAETDSSPIKSLINTIGSII